MMRSASAAPRRSPVNLRPMVALSIHSLPSGLTMTSITLGSASAAAMVGPKAVRSICRRRPCASSAKGMPRSNPVAELMRQCAAKIYRIEEGLRRRHADEVSSHVVVGLVAADADVCAGRPDQLLGLREDQAGVDRRHRGSDAFRQSLALLGVEHGEALQERD